MATICFAPIRLPRVRVTLLDACGTPVIGSCSSVSSKGVISIEQTAEIEDRTDFYTKNGDGDWCITETSPPILKWLNMTVTMCNVDPEMVNILTAEPLILNDAASPVSIGHRTREGSAALANFALEGWTRLAGSAGCSGSTVQYGYHLWPWNVEGMALGDVTYENGLATISYTSRTRPNSLWGVGPYGVLKSSAVATPNWTLPLLSPVAATDHRLMFVTTMAPPLDACGCTAINQAFTTPLSPAGLNVTLTFPSPSTTLPATINWGDGVITHVTSGTTAIHTYVAGTYTAKYYTDNYSAAPWAGTITV